MKKASGETELWVQDTIRAMLWTEHSVLTDKIPGSTLLKGHPDLLCGSKKLGAFYIEVKAPGKKLRWSQVDWCERWDSAFHIYVVDHPSKLWTTLGIRGSDLGTNSWKWAVPKGRRLASELADWSADRSTPETPRRVGESG